MKIYYGNFQLFLYQSNDWGTKHPLSAPEKDIDLPLSTPFEFVFESIDRIINLMKFAKYGTLSIPFESEDAQKAFFKDFRQHFDHDIAAAGGVVVRSEDLEAPLLMMRRGVWDLPKGKVEAWESNEIAAEREIKEETGLQKLKLIEPLTQTFHFYYHKKEWYFKTTYWYLFKAIPPYNLLPQVEEDITSLSWEKMDTDIIDNLFTFENIREVLWSYQKSATLTFDNSEVV